MQGSAGMAEDARQPPYACPVEEAQLARAVAEAKGQKVNGKREGGMGEEWISTWKMERREKLRGFCAEMGADTHLWRAYAAWLGALGGGLGQEVE